MLTEPTNRAADRLLAAAVDVERDDRAGGVAALPSELESLAEALRFAGRAVGVSALQVVPAAVPPEHGICSRFQRAAATWPTVPSPSHEAFAGALARLHDAAEAARVAAQRCDDAARAVESLLRTSQRSGLR